MTDELLNIEAVAGHNEPPEPTPFERVSQRIEELFLEGKNWLDGQPIANQDQAEAVATILRDMQAALKVADDLRAAEKKPHDDASKAVQAAFHPLIGDTKAGKGKAVRVIEGCKALSDKWLVKVEAEKRAKAEAARQEAVERERIAQEAMRASSVDDVGARERAEMLARQATAAKKEADRAEKDRAVIRGGGGRAISSRIAYEAVLIDSAAALKHAKAAWADDLKAWLVQRAQQDMDRKVLTIPGFEAKEHRSVA